MQLLQNADAACAVGILVIQQIARVIGQRAVFFFNFRETILIYTGSLFDEIRDLPFVPMIDVIVDGPYVEAQRDTQLHWKGSANQRVIDVTRTLSEGKIVLWA